jgi:hypothetical protein
MNVKDTTKEMGAKYHSRHTNTTKSWVYQAEIQKGAQTRLASDIQRKQEGA